MLNCRLGKNKKSLSAPGAAWKERNMEISILNYYFTYVHMDFLHPSYTKYVFEQYLPVQHRTCTAFWVSGSFQLPEQYFVFFGFGLDLHLWLFHL